jgi:lysophospholipase L1-like esterase
VLFVVYLGNDLEDIACDWRWTRPKPYYTLSDGALTLVKPRMTWSTRLRNTSYCAEFLYQKLLRGRDESRKAPEWASADTMPLFDALVRRIAESCAGRGARVLAVLAYPPEAIERGPNETEARARAILEVAGIMTLDTLEALAEAMRDGANVYDDDGIHWNAKGHEIVANAIQETLLEKSWLN